MRDEIIKFETAVLAKEKGLQFGCKKSYCEYHSSYEYDGDKTHPESYEKGDVRLDNFFTVNNYKNLDLSNEHFTIYEAPTQSLLQRWLREVHNIHTAILPKILPSNEIKYYCFKGKMKKDFEDLYDTYEEALETGLYEALELI